MKKVLLSLSILLIIAFLSMFYLLVLNKNKNLNIPSEFSNEAQETSSLTPQISEGMGSETSQDKDIKINWLIVRDLGKLKLYPNFEEKLTTAEAKKKYGCSALVSGGFYDQKGKPIGLFIASGEKLSEAMTNSLFDGYFSITKNNTPEITRVQPNSPRDALQSGPVLVLNGKFSKLSLVNDENARRVIASIDKKGNLIFIVFYKSDLPIQGPKLSELPKMLENLNKEKNLNIQNAINLDGGSASSFISEGVNLSEVTTVGSYFCLSTTLQLY